MTPTMLALLAAGEKLAARLRILQRLQIQARERGEEYPGLHTEELFEVGDLAALEAFEEAKARAMGQQPLPFEVTA